MVKLDREGNEVKIFFIVIASKLQPLKIKVRFVKMKYYLQK